MRRASASIVARSNGRREAEVTIPAKSLSLRLLLPSKFTMPMVGFSTTAIIKRPAAARISTSENSPVAIRRRRAALISAALKLTLKSRPERETIVWSGMFTLPETKTEENRPEAWAAADSGKAEVTARVLTPKKSEAIKVLTRVF